MNVFLWIVAGVLAVAFLGAGLMKLGRTREELAASGMDWAEDFSPGVVKAMGVLQIAGVVGLILPAAVNIAPVLVPTAALGLALMMFGAVIVHVRRKEAVAALPSLVLCLLALIVVWGRFGSYAF